MLLILVSISCVFLNGISAFWFNNGPTTEVPSNISTPIRLVGGQYPWEGRVEVKHNGQWGTICDDFFDINDTTVVCRMLGYNDTDGSVKYYGSSYFGRGYGPILIDDLDCSGEEDDVSECNRTDWFKNNCGHDEDVSVNCGVDIPIVRLVNGKSSLEGRVEVNANGSWGTICDDSFGVQEANVICGMLGYAKAGSVHYSGAHFGSGDGPIVLDDLNCRGTETNILDCQSRGLFQHNCGHGEDAGVACNGPTTEVPSNISTPVRLVGGNFNWEGRVEVYHGGQWGTICDDQFDRQDAQVICFMLGYNRYGYVTSYGRSRFRGGSGSIMLDNLECSGYENDIAQCTSNGWYQNDCSHSEDASISCANPKSFPEYAESSTYQYNTTTSDTFGRHDNISIRLTAGNRGLLMLYYNGRWGYVCYNSNQHAYQFNSVCRSLGYASAYRISRYYESRPAIVTDFYCPGYYYSNGVDDCTGRNFGNNTYCNFKLYITCDSLITEESVTKPLFSATWW